MLFSSNNTMDGDSMEMSELKDISPELLMLPSKASMGTQKSMGLGGPTVSNTSYIKILLL